MEVELISRTQSYALHSLGSVVHVRWHAPSTGDGFNQILGQLSEYRGSVDQDLTYVATLFPDEGNPTPELREALPKFFVSLKGYCSSAHVLVEETGLRAALVRSVATGICLAMGLGGFLKVYTNSTSLVEALQPLTDHPSPALLRLIKAE